MSWVGVFLPEVRAATGGGDNFDIKLPQRLRNLRVTAYNATAARGVITAYLQYKGTMHLVGAITPTIALDPLQVAMVGMVSIDDNTLRVTFPATVVADELHVTLSYEQPAEG